MTVEGGVEGAMVVVAELVTATYPWTSWTARRKQHYTAISSAFFLSSSTPEPELIARFEFGVTLYYDIDQDTIRLPRQFGEVVDEKMNQVLLRVRGGATGYWTAEVLYDHSGTPYLASGWRRFCRVHEIVAGHFVVFNYDDKHTLTVTVFDDTMCHRHYVAPARGKAATTSSSEDDE
jgi:hypothetical protein